MWSHPYNPTPLRNMLSGFPQLRKLSLEAGRSLGVTDSSTFFQLRFASLESFELIAFAYPEKSEALVSFINSHRGLQKLGLQFSSSSLPPLSEAPAIAHILPQLAALNTSTVLATSLFWPSSDHASFALSSLRLNDVDLGDWNGIANILGVVGQNLQNLSVQVQSQSNKALHNIFGLVADTCPRLSVLHVSMDIQDKAQSNELERSNTVSTRLLDSVHTLSPRLF